MHLRSKTKESFKTIHLEIINDMKNNNNSNKQQTITNVKSCYVKLTINNVVVLVRINDSKNNWSRSNNLCIVNFNGCHFLLKYNIWSTHIIEGQFCPFSHFVRSDAI